MKKNFARLGDLMFTSGDDAVALVGVEKGFGEQKFVTVGFCICRIGIELPRRVELAHMYFRLERLFPQYRECILAAGALDDSDQIAAFKQFLGYLEHTFAPDICGMTSEGGLVKAYCAGRFDAGLVTKQARDFLVSVTQAS
ncbi:hypothetical protein [Ectothiorhodospira lacustris]|uniref:hypothetical protein n=1 Tax=Ectothiorhodospira lacustris TaxID=2899127 RepID=UPI001EE94BD9|nr:hypothetical protein [Ectothiorhodospira lacustris]MCG5510083.1 hypothetical protein [Ectothiorhodospira lacustris]MCG5521829.1 hypothetical protein [Ectothiorhodospira lacustris]